MVTLATFTFINIIMIVVVVLLLLILLWFFVVSATKRARTETDNSDSRSSSPSKEGQREIAEEKINMSEQSPATSPTPCSDPDSPRSEGHTNDVVAKISLPEPGINPFSIMQHSINNRRAPLETLCRIFPHMKRSVLQLILQGCNSDIVQAIEQVLNNHPDQADRSTMLSTDPSSISVTTPSYLPPSLSGNTGFKSAFSPISSLSNAAAAHSALSSVRYTYGAGGRGLAFAMPYPPVLPTFAMGSAAYSYTGLAGPANKAFHYAMCPCCTVKPYSQTSTEKSTGCLGES